MSGWLNWKKIIKLIKGTDRRPNGKRLQWYTVKFIMLIIQIYEKWYDYTLHRYNIKVIITKGHFVTVTQTLAQCTIYYYYYELKGVPTRKTNEWPI